MEERLLVSDAHDAEDIETTGIITKLIVFRASGAVIIMSSALIVTLLSADAVHFELSHISMISLVELFLDRKEQMLGLMCQNVVMVAIGMIKSKLQVLNKEIMSKERLLSTSKKNANCFGFDIACQKTCDWRNKSCGVKDVRRHNS